MFSTAVMDNLSVDLLLGLPISIDFPKYDRRFKYVLRSGHGELATGTVEGLAPTSRINPAGPEIWIALAYKSLDVLAPRAILNKYREKSSRGG